MPEMINEQMTFLVRSYEKLQEYWNAAQKKKTPKNQISVRGFVSQYMAEKLEEKLKEADGKDVVVNINSYGGDVFAGFEMHNMLREYKGKVTTKVTGLAASAAAFMYLAGDERQIGENGMVMFHPAATWAHGFVEDFEKAIAVLGKIDAQLVKTMEKRMDLSDISDIRAFLLTEEFLDCDRCLELKVSTVKLEDEEEEEMEEEEEKEAQEDPEEEEMEEEEIREYAKKYRQTMAKHNVKQLIRTVKNGG